MIKNEMGGTQYTMGTKITKFILKIQFLMVTIECKRPRELR